jgi:hypothetical protein
MEILMSQGSRSNSELARAAFRSAEQLIHKTAELWKTDEAIIDLVPSRHLIQQEQKMRTLSRTAGDKLHVFIFLGLDLVGDEWVMDIRRNCKV